MATRLSNTVLGLLALVFAAAFVVLPRPLASVLSGGNQGDQRHLTAEVSSAFVGYWRARRRAFTPELLHLVDYWRWHHLVKAVAAIGLLVLLIMVAARLWTKHAHAGTRPSAAGGAAVTVLSLLAFVLVLANVQGTLAPFSSLLSLLPVTTARGDLAITIGQVQQAVAHYPNDSSQALQAMVRDLAVYHVVVAVISWFTAITLAVLLVRAWRARARTTGNGQGSRRLLGTFTVSALLVITFLAVLGLANATTAIDSSTAVRNFYLGAF